MTSVSTDAGALAAATAPGLLAVSMRKADRGAEAAANFSRVGATKRMSQGWEAQPLGVNGARVHSGPFYTFFHEYGFHANGTWVAPQPMARPSMDAARAG